MQLHNNTQEDAAPASKKLRTALRAHTLERIKELGLGNKDAAEAMGFDR